MLRSVGETRWRVAVTRDDESIDAWIQRGLDTRDFEPVSCVVLMQGPAPDPECLSMVARDLDRYDWVICASARAVKPLYDACGSRWPGGPRTAAVGKMTAAALRAAGAPEPVIGDAFNATSLLEKLRPLDEWHGRRVLVTTVEGGRRELIDGLRAAGATVTELAAYSMAPRSAADIRRDWEAARPDAVILGSPATAKHLIEAIGVGALHGLRAIVAIGPTTHAAVSAVGLAAHMPDQATFAASVERLRSLRDSGS